MVGFSVHTACVAKKFNACHMGGRPPWNYWGVITEIKGALIYTKRQL
jgi:hypothetical protein